MKKSAIVSSCERHRYRLNRVWDEDKGKVLFIMLNPSTADEETDDLTTIRCMNFAKRWGFGGIMIGNIYPFRAKRPKDLQKWLNQREYNGLWVHRQANISHVRMMSDKASVIVCAWGCNHKGIPDWIKEINNLHYLELCDDNITPKHPLGNLSNDLKPIEYKLNTIKKG